MAVRWMARAFSTVLAVLLAAGAAFAEPPTAPATAPADAQIPALRDGLTDLIEPTPGGYIDWTAGVVIAEGMGVTRGRNANDALMAKRGAHLVAARNAAFVLMGIHMGPGGGLDNIADGSIQMKAVLKGIEEISNDFDPKSRTALAKIRLPIYGASGVARFSDISVRRAAKAWDWPVTTQPAEAQASVAVEWIVLDMRGQGFTPVLFPRLVTPDGRCVLEAADIDGREIVARGMVRYVACTVQPDAAAPVTQGAAIVGPVGAAVAQAVRRNFADSLVLGGCRAVRDQPGEIVLTAECEQYFTAHPAIRRVLRSGKIIILTSAGPGPKRDASRVP